MIFFLCSLPNHLLPHGHTFAQLPSITQLRRPFAQTQCRLSSNPLLFDRTTASVHPLHKHATTPIRSTTVHGCNAQFPLGTHRVSFARTTTKSNSSSPIPINHLLCIPKSNSSSPSPQTTTESNSSSSLHTQTRSSSLGTLLGAASLCRRSLPPSLLSIHLCIVAATRAQTRTCGELPRTILMRVM